MVLGAAFGAGLAGGAASSSIIIAIRAVDDYSKEMNKAKKATEKLGGEFSKTTFLASKLAVVGYAAAATAVIGFGVASVNAARQLEPIKRGFEDLTTGSKDFLKQLQIATEGTATQFSLMKAANNALLLGIDQDKLPGMFKAAAIIGQAAGRTTEEAMNDITLGIARQSRLILDNIGIIVDAETAYKKFAEANNIVGRSLTDVEKKLAFQTEAVFQAEQKAKALGGVLEHTLNYELDRLKVNFNEIQIAAGESIQEGGLNDFLSWVNRAIDRMQEFNAQGQKMAELKVQQNLFTTQTSSATPEQLEEAFRQVPLRKTFAQGGNLIGSQFEEAMKQDELERTRIITDMQLQDQLLQSQGLLTSAEQLALGVKDETIKQTNELIDAEVAYKVGMENLTETGAELIIRQSQLKAELQKVRDESYEAVPALKSVSGEISKMVDDLIKKTGGTGGGETPSKKGGSSGYLGLGGLAKESATQYGLDLTSANPAARINAENILYGRTPSMKVSVTIDGANHTKSNQVSKSKK